MRSRQPEKHLLKVSFVQHVSGGIHPRLVMRLIYFFAVLICGESPSVAIFAESDAVQELGEWNQVYAWQLEAESELLFYDGLDESKIRRYFTHRIIAASSETFYYMTGHADKLSVDSWKHEPFNLAVTLSNGQMTFNHLFNRSYSVQSLKSGDEMPRVISNDVCCFIVPIWPSEEYKPPQDASREMVFPAGNAIRDGGYRETEERQNVAGEPCRQFVSPKGEDRIWISENKPLCVMLREWMFPGTHDIKARLLTKKIKEVGTGLWLPAEIEETQFARSGGSGELRIMRKAQTRVLDWRENSNVPPELFQPKLKAGSILEEGANRFVQTHPGGLDHLDSICSYLGDRGGHARTFHSSRSTMNMVLDVILGMTLGAVSSLLWGGLRIRRKCNNAPRNLS